MFKRCKYLVTLMVFNACCAMAGVDLCHIYQSALTHDPAYRAAIATYQAARETSPQAWSALLPDIRFSSELSSTRRNFTSNQGVLPFEPTGRAYNYSLTLTQPLLAFDKVAALRQAGHSVKQAWSNWRKSEQDLIVRVVSAYFEILEAQDSLRFTQAEKRAHHRQLEQSKQRYKVGLDAVTSVYNAQASYDSVVAQEIAAKNALNNQREALRAITGKFYKHIKPLKDKTPLVIPSPASPEKWVQTALRQNWSIQEAWHAMRAAEQDIRVKRSGHLPTLSLQALLNGGESTSRNIVTGTAHTTRTQDARMSLKMDLPILQGGLVASRDRQAQRNLDASLARLDQVKLQTMTQMRQTYHSIIAGISQVKAGKQAVQSSRSSLKSTETALKAGTRTIVNLINAQRDLTQAQRQLAADRYRYIKNTLALKEIAGNLSEQDVRHINHWLAH